MDLWNLERGTLEKNNNKNKIFYCVKTKNNPANQYLNKYIHKAVKENINLKNNLERIPYVLLPKVNVNISLAKFKKENTALIVYKI